MIYKSRGIRFNKQLGTSERQNNSHCHQRKNSDLHIYTSVGNKNKLGERLKYILLQILTPKFYHHIHDQTSSTSCL